ncbi:uncharacterized protein ACA1_130530 [Acanthamoeba castellanii str. Neff]|uniref:Uncharacterized protein n=1 Tax=Acanthamoeba castellanii (strain ATCC 30010 / Neff) TaxID=1257118 RepID=L8GQC4_ACACF|nr:uncharacterized protein ACA1_130530 [Acanthamoeba castellanii str. Neff]ELR14858.1 hypothetical protein ACA1_130530 [Acanthamoeba castellanii str. Neff]
MVPLFAADEPQSLQVFRKAGGVEAIVRLFLAIDLTSPLPIWAAPEASTTSSTGTASVDNALADGETETGRASGITSESNDDGSAPTPVGDDVSNKNESESESEKEKEKEKENENESEKAGDGAEGERQLEEGGREAAAAAEEASDDALVPLLDTAEPSRSLTHLLVQTLWMFAGSIATPEDRCKVGTAKVIEQATAMFESDRTDIQTKVCSIAFLSCLVRNDKASIPVLMTTRARSVMFRAFAEATPDTDAELLTRLAYALTPILGHNSADRSCSIKTMFQKGIVKHTFDLLEHCLQDDAKYNMTTLALFQILTEMAGFADVATCRQILDRQLAASLIRVVLKRLETSEWAALADTLIVLNSLLSERTAPFRPTRQRFQGVFIETETEVSEAAGRTATGLDALVDVLNQAIHPLAPYAIAAIFLLCEDNAAVQEFMRNNERAMDTLRRFGEPDNPGHAPAQELLLYLSMRHSPQ